MFKQVPRAQYDGRAGQWLRSWYGTVRRYYGWWFFWYCGSLNWCWRGCTASAEHVVSVFTKLTESSRRSQSRSPDSLCSCVLLPRGCSSDSMGCPSQGSLGQHPSPDVWRSVHRTGKSSEEPCEESVQQSVQSERVRA